jgi:hypothetical protein
MFEDAVCTFLKARDWMHVAALVHLLDMIYQKGLPPPQGVHDALLQRIRLHQSPAEAETNVFHLLRRWAPAILVDQPWERYWNDWLPDARVSVADAIGECSFAKRENQERAIALLLLLARDGRYAVRRSAYRALSRQSDESLYRFCVTAVHSIGQEGSLPTLELRKRGAEACAWIRSDQIFDEIYEQYATDPERSVLETVERMFAERRMRMEAALYLKAILGVSKGETHEILSAWRFGHALMRIGDDTCIRAIRAHMGSSPPPPNVRYCLAQIVEGMEESWRKTTQKWPEPWNFWEGAIQEGQGIISLGPGEDHRVRYTLWLQPAVNTTTSGAWGGIASLKDELDMFELSIEGAMLILPDGSRGAVQIRNNSLTDLTFSGIGPYPR